MIPEPNTISSAIVNSTPVGVNPNLGEIAATIVQDLYVCTSPVNSTLSNTSAKINDLAKKFQDTLMTYQSEDIGMDFDVAIALLRTWVFVAENSCKNTFPKSGITLRFDVNPKRNRYGNRERILPVNGVGYYEYQEQGVSAFTKRMFICPNNRNDIWITDHGTHNGGYTGPQTTRFMRGEIPSVDGRYRAVWYKWNQGEWYKWRLTPGVIQPGSLGDKAAYDRMDILGRNCDLGRKIVQIALANPNEPSKNIINWARQL
ncbi:hypothetical protein EUZ85_29895 [Hahella sp. KA22]|uniref:hypothetical protein n=1 Tax=Hahella sp. KA22 TaxID=1628392 RepID=UPI000FDE59C4|nr:hypothetical protein [Hahella sp. KA22]AZZ94698.1 hypothetical protein ENC22_27310 [Hahella sp. KA22]QAY58071.1 hypothetical protein EUZ85_29895 [Hahella sp. KA22]